MFGSLARRLSVLAAGAALVAAVAAPVVVDAAGLIPGPQSRANVTPALAPGAELRVKANGVTVDTDGHTVYTFVVKNIGAGTAQGVKVTKLSQIKELAQPQLVRNTITVVEYDEIRSGQEMAVSILCEKSARYTCTYGSVDVDAAGTESSTADNFAAQSI